MFVRTTVSLFLALFVVTLAAWFVVNAVRVRVSGFASSLTPNFLSLGLSFLVLAAVFSWFYVWVYQLICGWFGVEGDLSQYFQLEGVDTEIPGFVLAIVLTVAWIPLAVYSAHLADESIMWKKVPSWLVGAVVAIVITLTTGFFLVSCLSLFETVARPLEEDLFP